MFLTSQYLKFTKNKKYCQQNFKKNLHVCIKLIDLDSYARTVFKLLIFLLFDIKFLISKSQHYKNFILFL